MKKTLLVSIMLLFALAFIASANNASMVTNLSIKPVPAHTDANVYCEFIVTDADPGQSLSVNYTFYNGSTVYRTGTAGVATGVLKQIYLVEPGLGTAAMPTPVVSQVAVVLLALAVVALGCAPNLLIGPLLSAMQGTGF